MMNWIDTEPMVRFSHLMVVVTAAILLGGCRTYGGYGSVEATQDAIAAETARAAEDLQRAARSLRALSAAAEGDARLAPVVADFALVHDIHTELVASYEARLGEFVDEGSYRKVSRRLGAMLAEQRQIRHAYQSLDEAAALMIGPDRIPDITVPDRMYGVYPAVYYARWYSERLDAVDQVIRSAASGS